MTKKFDNLSLADRKNVLLTYIQPGLAGLIDGTLSTLAPVFATAFATGDPRITFLVGISASLGAGISMGFTEYAADDGVLTGRGSPIKRGLSCGLMTAFGGLFHTLPYLLNDFWTATLIAIITVIVELCLICWIQHKYMKTSWKKSLVQVVLGGILVLSVGVYIGGS